MGLCQFQDVLGKPRLGSHAIRIPVIDVAMIDVLMTAVAALATAKFQLRRWPAHFLGWFVVAQILHIVFCVRTRVVELIF